MPLQSTQLLCTSIVLQRWPGLCAGRGLPWDALAGGLDPSVHVTLLRSEHGPVFYAGMSGAAFRPASMLCVTHSPGGHCQLLPVWSVAAMHLRTAVCIFWGAALA